ncbi:hypothetical protein [Saccharopolyspora spinosa]|uniref:hypothetical protein n=1 Tax=Saccharopolyspora spinosa TaxID=60894 RepID=UPI00117A8222|nr:hypothetical protein [Saccharopolyspora spinosa]
MVRVGGSGAVFCGGSWVVVVCGGAVGTFVGPSEISGGWPGGWPGGGAGGEAGGGTAGFAGATPLCCPAGSGARMGAASDPVESCGLVLTAGEPAVPLLAPVSSGAEAAAALGGGGGGWGGLGDRATSGSPGTTTSWGGLVLSRGASPSGAGTVFSANGGSLLKMPGGIRPKKGSASGAVNV